MAPVIPFAAVLVWVALTAWLARGWHRCAVRERAAVAALVPHERTVAMTASLDDAVDAARERIEAAYDEAAARTRELREMLIESESDWLTGPRMQALVDALDRPLCVPDVGAEAFIVVNECFASALGLTPADMNGRAWVDFIADDDVLQAVTAERDEHQADVDAGRPSSAVFHCVYTHQDGSRVPIVWDCGPNMGAAGPAFYIGRA